MSRSCPYVLSLFIVVVPAPVGCTLKGFGGFSVYPAANTRILCSTGVEVEYDSSLSNVT